MAESGQTTANAPQVRRAGADDAPAAGRLLDAFNREYDWPTPGADALAARIAELLPGSDLAVLVVDDPRTGGSGAGGGDPLGIAVLRFRPSLWSRAQECYLAELYVVPERRGEGLGRALLGAALDLARAEGADTIDLGTSEDDVAARGLYESFGFTNRENGPDGPVTFFYEREL